MKEEKLLLLLQKKRGFFEAILDLTEKEEQLSINDLVPHLEQKRVLLSCIEEIDESLSPFQQSLHILSQDITEELDAIRKVIETILHLDERNLHQRRRSLKHHE